MSTIITDLNQLDTDATYTYADYMPRRIEGQLELIRGRFLKCRPHLPCVISKYREDFI